MEEIKEAENLKEDISIDKTEKSSMQAGKMTFLPVGMIFQFLFTVIGGGLLISGLIVGIRVGFDMNLQNNLGRISILMIAFGFLMFLIGVALAIILYKLATTHSGG